MKSRWEVLPPQTHDLGCGRLVRIGDLEDRCLVTGRSRLDGEPGRLAREESLPNDRVLNQVNDVGRAAPQVGASRLLELLAEQPPGGLLIAPVSFVIGGAQPVRDDATHRL